MSDSAATSAVTSADPIASPPEDNAPPARSTNALNIWPPSQRTRDAVISRLIETLSKPSVLSKRYGTIPPEEAAEAARRIEEQAFGSSNEYAASQDDGIEVLQHYSKDISKRMLETVKSRSGTDTPATPPLESIEEEVSASEEASA
ncbi:MFP1 attachment factor 1 [Linum perenne]